MPKVFLKKEIYFYLQKDLSSEFTSTYTVTGLCLSSVIYLLVSS